MASPIDEKYATLGGPRGWLGEPTSEEGSTPDGKGSFRHFQNEVSIYWSPRTGAHAIGESVRAKWASVGGEQGFLGYPVTDEASTAHGTGRFVQFENGIIYSTATMGPQVVSCACSDPSRPHATGAIIDGRTSDFWNFPTPAALELSTYIDNTGAWRSEGLRKPVNENRYIHWETEFINTRMVVPTARLRLGPFRLRWGIVYRALPDARPEELLRQGHFSVRVFARSPAIYIKDLDDSHRKFSGNTLKFIEVGSASETVTGFGEKEIYVFATLPSVFNALVLTAQVTGPIGSDVETFPSDCSQLPSKLPPADMSGNTFDPDSLDTPCLQVAVNPLALLVPKVVPLAIIYEPPGNCSWANLTQEHTAGAAIAVEEAQSTSTRTISDASVFGFSVDHKDFSETKLDSSERTSQVHLKLAKSFGTALGLPLESPGNPDCNRTGATVPPRENSGPGRGDLYIFLARPAMVYWNTGNMSNFLFSSENPPGTASGVIPVPAWRIASGEGLDDLGIHFTEDERKAILALDPFTDPAWETPSPQDEEFGPFRVPRLPKRFVHIDFFQLPPGVAMESGTRASQLTAGAIRHYMSHGETTTESEGLDLPVKLTMQAFAFGGGVAAGAAARKFVEFAGTQWGSASQQKSFKDMEDAVRTISLPLFYDYHSETSVTVSYSQSRIIGGLAETATTQNFFIKDTNKAMNVAIYYDSFFGTFAFVPLRASTGMLSGEMRQRNGELPSFAWTISSSPGEHDEQAMPDRLAQKLDELGAKSYRSASSEEYVVPSGFVQGLPLGLEFDQKRRRLVGPVPSAQAAKIQALLFAVNHLGEICAQVWINIGVSP